MLLLVVLKWKRSITILQNAKKCNMRTKSEGSKKFFLSCWLIIWAVIGYKFVYMFHYLDLFKEPQQKNTVQFSVPRYWHNFQSCFCLRHVFVYVSSGKRWNNKFGAKFNLIIKVNSISKTNTWVRIAG